MDPLQRFINDSEFLQSLLSEKNEEEELEETNNFLTKEYIETLTNHKIDNVLSLYSGNYFFTTREFIKIAKILNFFICNKLKEISLIIKHNICKKNIKIKDIPEYLLERFETFNIFTQKDKNEVESNFNLFISSEKEEPFTPKIKDLIECLIFYEYEDGLFFYLENDEEDKNYHNKNYFFHESLKTNNIKIIKIVYDKYEDNINQGNIDIFKNKILNIETISWLFNENFIQSYDCITLLRYNILSKSNLNNDTYIFIFSYLSLIYKNSKYIESNDSNFNKEIKFNIKETIKLFIIHICNNGNLELFNYITNNLSNNNLVYNSFPLIINGYMGEFRIEGNIIASGTVYDNIEIYKYLYEKEKIDIFPIPSILSCQKINVCKWLYDIGKINTNMIKEYSKIYNCDNFTDSFPFPISLEFFEWIFSFGFIIFDIKSKYYYNLFSKFDKGMNFEKIKFLLKYNPKLNIILKKILDNLKIKNDFKKIDDITECSKENFSILFSQSFKNNIEKLS